MKNTSCRRLATDVGTSDIPCFLRQCRSTRLPSQLASDYDAVGNPVVISNRLLLLCWVGTGTGNQLDQTLVSTASTGMSTVPWRWCCRAEGRPGWGTAGCWWRCRSCERCPMSRSVWSGAVGEIKRWDISKINSIYELRVNYVTLISQSISELQWMVSYFRGVVLFTLAWGSRFRYIPGSRWLEPCRSCCWRNRWRPWGCRGWPPSWTSGRTRHRCEGTCEWRGILDYDPNTSG